MVSIIIPVYNVRNYMVKCLDSVAAQTYTGEMECLIIDDCGQDDSIRLAEEFIYSYTGIIDFRIIHREKNGGLSAARNTGLDNAEGEYIYFLDSDDWIEPDTLKVAIAEIGKGYDLVSFGYNVDYSTNKVQEVFSPKEADIRFTSLRQRVRFLYSEFLRFKYGWSAWSRVFKRDIIEKNNLRFVDNKRIFAEDLCFSLCYFMLINSYKCLDFQPYHYIQRGSSIMGNDIKKNNLGRIIELSKAVNEYIKDTNSVNKGLTKYLPLIDFGILWEDCIMTNTEGISIPNKVQDLTDEQKLSFKRMLDENRTFVSLDIIPIYMWCLVNIISLQWIEKQMTIKYKLFKLLLKICLFRHKEIYISNEMLMVEYQKSLQK